MDKCRVLFAVNAMNMGGLENFVMNVVRNIDLSKFHVEFLYCDDRDSYFDSEIEQLGFKITRIISRSKNIFRHLKELKVFFGSNSFDVVHINYANSLCFTVARAAKKIGIKKVIIHSHASKGLSKKSTIIHNIFKPFVERYANVYFSCSDLASKWMFTKKINSQGKVTVVNNAIKVSNYLFDDEKRKEIREQLNIAEDAFVIGHVGRFSYPKNHSFLVDVFKEYNEINPKSKLLLLGDGELKNDITLKVNQLNLQDSVIFAGVREDVCDVMSAIDCFVMPSFCEGLPVTLVEAQANGLRCLVSDTVTKEVSITDIIEYFSLEKTAKEWANMIKLSPKNRADYNATVGESGFDINQVLNLLEKVYCE